MNRLCHYCRKTKGMQTTNQLKEVQELWPCAEGERATGERAVMMKEARGPPPK